MSLQAPVPNEAIEIEYEHAIPFAAFIRGAEGHARGRAVGVRDGNTSHFSVEVYETRADALRQIAETLESRQTIAAEDISFVRDALAGAGWTGTGNSNDRAPMVLQDLVATIQSADAARRRADATLGVALSEPQRRVVISALRARADASGEDLFDVVADDIERRDAPQLYRNEHSMVQDGLVNTGALDVTDDELSEFEEAVRASSMVVRGIDAQIRSFEDAPPPQVRSAAELVNDLEGNDRPGGNWFWKNGAAWEPPTETPAPEYSIMVGRNALTIEPAADAPGHYNWTQEYFDLSKDDGATQGLWEPTDHGVATYDEVIDRASRLIDDHATDGPTTDLPLSEDLMLRIVKGMSDSTSETVHTDDATREVIEFPEHIRLRVTDVFDPMGP